MKIIGNNSIQDNMLNYVVFKSNVIIMHLTRFSRVCARLVPPIIYVSLPISILAQMYI